MNTINYYIILERGEEVERLPMSEKKHETLCYAITNSASVRK